jgi:hypothetical protein
MKPVRIRSAASVLRGAKVKRDIGKGARLADLLLTQAEPFLPGGVREYRFHGERLWRFDIAWPEQAVSGARRIAVEVEGGAWVKGGHTRGLHFKSDIEKYAEAQVLGWIVLRVMPEHVISGKAADWLYRIAARDR